jgi:hypothetical protein
MGAAMMLIKHTRLCPPPQLGYTFYGDYKLDLRCKQWFDDISDRFLTWPEFRDESDERMICARDGVEQYVMQRIGEYAFRSTQDAEGDEALLRRMKLLSFVRPEVRFLCPLCTWVWFYCEIARLQTSAH